MTPVAPKAMKGKVIPSSPLKIVTASPQVARKAETRETSAPAWGAEGERADKHRLNSKELSEEWAAV